MKTLAHDRCKAEIVGRLRSVSPHSARRWGRMTAHQMICHLNDCFRVMTGQKRASDATGPLQRTMMKWIALYAPLPWPPGIATRPEIDQLCEGTRPVDFAADVAETEAFIDLITTPENSCDGNVHPIFGPMSQAAWLRWAYLHMDHHLRQFGA